MKPSNVKICLNAMVKNESNTILRMLNSVYQYIDYWVIQDNGSTDGTQDIIKNFFAEKNIPGFLYQTEWLYPGWNRNHTLQTCLKAKHGCDWILRMDADEQLIVDDSFDWNILTNTSIESWNIPAESGSTIYFRTWLWNSKLPWFFADDKRHETIHLPEVGEGFQRVELPFSFRHFITNDGMTWYKPMKFLTDALTLELDNVPTNKVLEDKYHLWYIGKSYSDCYGDLESFPYKRLHAEEYARRSIFYFEMYLNVVHNWLAEKCPKDPDDMGYMAMILIGDAYKFLKDYDKAEFHYSSAHRFNPFRNENFLSLCFMFEEIQQYRNMLNIAQVLLSEHRKNPFPKYSFFINKNAYYDTSVTPMTLFNKAKEKLNV